jgi:hypothetical protein
MLLVSGKSLNPIGNYLLAQRYKIPRSTCFIHVLMLVEILKFWAWNFFLACMSLKYYCCASLGIYRYVWQYIEFNACSVGFNGDK